MPGEPGASDLKSPRHSVLQMTERNPGVQGDTGAVVARPAPVTSGNHAHKNLWDFPLFTHSFIKKYVSYCSTVWGF